MKDFIKKTLDFDPLGEAEKVAESSGATQEEITALGFTFMRQRSNMMERLMEQSGDVHWGLSFSDYCSIVQEQGFKLVHDHEFDPGEHFRIYWQPLGFLLTVESYQGVRVNSAKLYYNLHVDTPEKRDELMEYTSSGSWIEWDDDNSSYTWAGDHDVREALCYHVEELAAHAQVLTKWRVAPYMWLINYQEGHSQSKDYRVDSRRYDDINTMRIASLPNELRDMLQAAVKKRYANRTR
jgi:hypothetical protein